MPLALRALVQSDWRRQDAIDGSAESYRVAAQKQAESAGQLLAELQAAHGAAFLPDAAQQLADLAGELAAAGGDDSSARTAWLNVRRYKRRIALANPLLDFGPLLVCQQVPPSWSHLVAQYFGWRQRPGGGLYVIERPGHSLAARDILRGQLPPGSVLEPRLSYDARRILFAFVPCSNDVPEPASLPLNEAGSPDRYFHLYEINVDGSGLRQLTDGPYDDMMAEYLPDGEIVFCSTRRKGYSRCFGPEYSYRWHTYTLHRMNADGGNIRTLSYNDVSEWFPAVANSGHVLHARWDYIDRDAVTHQNLWSMRPDGTNPVAVWGNATPKPHCVFQAKPIPNSHKIVFIGSAHHSITAGPVCVVDPAVDVNSQDAVPRITPLPFPGGGRSAERVVRSALAALGAFLPGCVQPVSAAVSGRAPDRSEPRQRLGDLPAGRRGQSRTAVSRPGHQQTNPLPLAPRPRPPVLPAAAWRRAAARARWSSRTFIRDSATCPAAASRNCESIQIFPKSTWLANQPMMGVAGEENGRAILGTVPVEPDGSAYFELPAGKPVLFQALDERGMAYQTMRSLTFVQPGERTSCIGCHEHRMSSPPSDARPPLALRRPPSAIQPGDLGGRPFRFVEMVQPVLDRHCVRCHGGEKTEARPRSDAAQPHKGFTRSYRGALPGAGPGRARQRPRPGRPAVRAVFPAAEPNPGHPAGGVYGARGSRLLKLLLDGPRKSGTHRDESAGWPPGSTERHLLRRLRCREPGEATRRPAGRHAGDPVIRMWDRLPACQVALIATLRCKLGPTRQRGWLRRSDCEKADVGLCHRVTPQLPSLARSG